MRQVLKIPGAKRNLTAMGPLPRPVNVRPVGRAGEGGGKSRRRSTNAKINGADQSSAATAAQMYRISVFTWLIIVHCRYAVGFASLVPNPDEGTEMYGGRRRGRGTASVHNFNMEIKGISPSQDRHHGAALLFPPVTTKAGHLASRTACLNTAKMKPSQIFINSDIKFALRFPPHHNQTPHTPRRQVRCSRDCGRCRRRRHRRTY